MNPREKKLALIVGLLLTAVVGLVVYTGVSDALASRQRKRKTLQTKVTAQNRQIAAGRQAAASLSQWRERSLPTKIEMARSLYLDRLNEIVRTSGLVGAEIRATGTSSSRGGAFRELSFSISAQADLSQIVDFLDAFYRQGHLHKLRSLSLLPQKQSGQFKIAVAIHALVLPRADRKDQLTKLPSEALSLASADDYKQIILGRNLFGPLNHPPRFSSVSSKRVHAGDRISFDLVASDADSKDKLSFRLANEKKPSGASVSSRGSFSWSPGKSLEPGEYSFTVLARDDGRPPKESQATFLVTVQPPRKPVPIVRRDPPRPSMSEGQHAYVEGIVESRGRPEVWIRIRTSNKILKLGEGDSLKVGRLEGKVTRIGEDDVELEFYQQRYLVTLGKSLKDAQRIAGEGL